MAIVQPKLNVSTEVFKGIQKGIYRFDGGVVRNVKTGAIVELLKPVISTRGLSKMAKVGIGVGVTVVAGVAAFFAGRAVVKTINKKERRESENQLVEVLSCPEVNQYISNINDQSMSLNSIRALIDFLDTCDRKGSNINLSDDELSFLENIIIKYTVGMCKSNSLNPNVVIEMNNKEKSRNVSPAIRINKLLGVQEMVFLNASPF